MDFSHKKELRKEKEGEKLGESYCELGLSKLYFPNYFVSLPPDMVLNYSPYIKHLTTMEYYELYNKLRTAFDTGKNSDLPELGISIFHNSFFSEGAKYYLPGSEHLFCKDHNLAFSSQSVRAQDDLDKVDYEIECNIHFEYHIVQPLEQKLAEGVIIVFHGLNEKKWDKYLPWAYALTKRTGKAVVLFPIAFHMGRAPERWSSRQEMYAIAQKRMSEFADNSDTSYVNAATSTRLDAFPQRLFWSGLQTYNDIVQLITDIKAGGLKNIAANAEINLFGYSIGSFLSVILMMANPKGYFTNAKLFCFCGGMTIDRMFPISKYIMDGRAAISMQKTFAELLSTNFKNDTRLQHYQDSNLHFEEGWFKTMLRYNYYQKEREKRFSQLEKQIKAFVLEKDEVTPPVEALNTLKGGYRNINIEVEVDDFPYPYSHVNPFALTTKNAPQVTEAFERFVTSAAEFYNR